MTIRGPYVDVDIPEVSLPELVLGKASGLGDKPALIDGPSGRTLTYAQLAGAVKKVAAGLAERGLRKGDVLAILSPNVPEYAVIFHAVASLGGVNTTINPLYTVDELIYQLDHSGAKYLFTTPQFMDRAEQAAQKVGIEEIFVLGEAEGATPISALMESSADMPQVEIDPKEDLVVLPYSSGTTGLPKGVILSHHNIVANICQADVPHSTTSDDVIIGVLPFFHIYGMTVIMNIALYLGATVVTMPRFDLEQFLQVLQDYKVTRAYLVPPIVLALAKHPVVDNYDLSSLEVITSGAAPLGPDLAEACAERLDCLVLQGYGLTETSPVTHMTPDRKEKNKPGAIGQLIPNTECRIVSVETGEDQPAGEAGEIWIRGPQVMRGYLNDDESTRQTIDDEGWLHTGDIGKVDEDGYFYIVDRVKELIKYKGYQVAPAELEALLVSHPSIADAAVIPIPDEEAGEIPKAFIVRAGEIGEDEIMSYIAERVAPYKKIRVIEFVEEIPKSASGKILRRVLVEKERSSF
jgi:acyl-CoA synthetase (AMP-forming)/AMP-acid ligase II